MSDQQIDRSVLVGLKMLMEDSYAEFLETFLKDSVLRLKQLRDARNTDELGLAAHSFKGSCGNMGAIVLVELCRQLEERIKTRQLQNIEDVVNQIDQAYRDVRPVYEAERAGAISHKAGHHIS